MKSKYLTIKKSDVYTDENGNAYPDIFSFPNDKLTLTRKAQKYILNANDIARFDTLISSYYGIADYDDLVLWINEINYIGDVAIGTEIILPDKNDLDDFYRDYSV
jgi:hypothetical protein